MPKDDLKNWLAVLGLGGGLALGASPSSAAPPPERPEPPRLPPGYTVEGPSLYYVINHEEQYSIWPSTEEIPRGWRRMGGPVELETVAERFPGDDRQRFRVVINHEEQYSIWPLDREPPQGFRPARSPELQRPCEIELCVELVEKHRRSSRR